MSPGVREGSSMTGPEQGQELGQGFTAEERENLRAIARVIGAQDRQGGVRITQGRAPDDTLSLAHMVMKPGFIGVDLPELEALLALSVRELLLICRAIDVALAPAPAQEGTQP